MANEELVEEVRKLSKKGRSTDVIRNMLSKDHERAEVDEAVQNYIDTYIIKEVKSSKQKGGKEENPRKNPIGVFFLSLLLFKGVLPPMIVFIIVLWLGIRLFVSRLFPLDSNPLVIYFFLFFGFIIYLMQSGVLVFLITAFRGSESVENPYSKALMMNMFIMVIGAATLSMFIYSATKMNVVFLIIAPVIYLFIISFAYNISVIRAFVPGVIIALINNVLNILLLFSAGYLFLGKSILPG